MALNSVILTLAGIVLAFWSGATLVSPPSFAGFSLLAAILAAPIAARGGRPWRSALTGTAAMALLLLVALITVNTIYRGVWLLPSLATIAASALAAVSAASFAASLTAWIARRWSATAAAWTFRVFLVALLIAWRLLPDGFADYLSERAVIDGIIVPVLTCSAVLLSLALVLSPPRDLVHGLRQCGKFFGRG